MLHPRVSIVIATHNRHDVVMDTLSRLENIAPGGNQCEIIVVDNASTDGTATTIRDRFPFVSVIARAHNRGSCAKSFGVARSSGEFLVFLDDDSYPDAASIDRMIRHFEADASLGAAGFTVHLPDGRRECAALPHVFVGCGVGFRANALRGVGGLDAGLFMQAEEYDLAFRLVGAGWRIRTFGDLHVAHQKTAHARISARTMYYDTRNNLMLADRYLPAPHRRVYVQDWRRRYGWLAETNGHRRAYWRGRLAATVRCPSERIRFAGQRLPPDALETLFRWRDVENRMAQLFDDGVRRIVLADLGKNIYPFHHAAPKTGVSVLAITDDRFHRPGRRYRGTPLISTTGIASLRPDAIVISNMAPVHAAATRRRLAVEVDHPIHLWFDESPITIPPQFESTAVRQAADRPTSVIDRPPRPQVAIAD
ncbi:MAG: glycosyltransferase [Phycisphaerales bacterium]|nr:glycosyltransferase [Phycisphaerales bacterium]